ncbi:MAG: hypothetical protein JW940_38550 [Polyangiaceae bacterium]|nr:hypothetical protein [Polyangiaceae bacterium]
MTPRKPWFALLGPALAASLAAAASAQPKGAPARPEAADKHPAPGMHAGRGGPPAMVGRGPLAKDKDKGKHNAKGKGEHEGKTGVRPRPPGALDGGVHHPPGARDGGLRRPPDFRLRHRAAPNPELRKKWQERRADQMKRRREALQQLRERWGEEQLNKPEVKAAIKVHAWRMARLRRIRELALRDPDGKDLVEKADNLIEKEQERFQLQMARLKRGSDVGTVGDTASAPPVPPPAAAKGPGQKEEAPKPATANQEGAK